MLSENSSTLPLMTKYGTVFEAGGPDEIGPIVGFAPVTGDSAPDYFAF